MNAVLSIALNQWRLWLRSNLALISFGGFTLLLLLSCVISTQKISSSTQVREELQIHAENTFFAQPSRHPHRMIHYGHYLFRVPPPLSFIDPGIDEVSGQTIFLEGHSQNTAMFADAKAIANLGSISSLSPAFFYQVFLPLFVIVIGYSIIIQERESRTLENLMAQGITGSTLYLGKSLALYSVCFIFLSPLFLLVTLAVRGGETSLASYGMFLMYTVYIFFYCSLVILVSSVTTKQNVALGILVAFWLISTFIIPRIAVSAADATIPMMGKIESDLEMQRELRELGDGHNASDPAFSSLLDELLTEHNVGRVEDLPVNFRGVVALHAEAKLTKKLRQFAENRMASERIQSQDLEKFGWISPTLAISKTSRAIAGTDLLNQHRFLRESEELRFDFVQGLNKVHAEQLQYSDDIARSSDPEAEKRTRVSSENWKTLRTFRFTPDSAELRWDRAKSLAFPLILWLLGCTILGVLNTRRLAT